MDARGQRRGRRRTRPPGIAAYPDPRRGRRRPGRSGRRASLRLGLARRFHPRQIRARLGRFQLWCDTEGLTALPAHPGTVAVYLARRADGGLSPAALGLALAAIGWVHRQAGHVAPHRAEGGGVVADVLSGARRSHARPPWRKAAADGAVLAQVLAALAGEDLRAVRDRAMARVVQARVAAAGLDPATFGGHPLRAGFVTAAAYGASAFRMREVSWHKSIQVLADYVRTARAFEDHPGEGFL